MLLGGVRRIAGPWVMLIIGDCMRGCLETAHVSSTILLVFELPMVLRLMLELKRILRRRGQVSLVMNAAARDVPTSFMHVDTIDGICTACVRRIRCFSQRQSLMVVKRRLCSVTRAASHEARTSCTPGYGATDDLISATIILKRCLVIAEGELAVTIIRLMMLLKQLLLLLVMVLLSTLLFWQSLLLIIH